MASDRTKKFAKITQGKAFRIISNTVSTLILIVSIILCAVVVISAKSGSGAPNFGGYSFLAVRSNSMEDEFYVGDLIVIRRFNAAHQYKVGDIISFMATDLAGDRFINTHRIIEVVENGGVSYVTKGDNAEKPDSKRVNPSKTRILGQYTGKRIAGLGKVLDFAGTSKGILFTVVIPAALIVIWQLLNYLLSLSEQGLQPVPQTQTAAAQTAPQIYPPAAVDKDAVIREYLQQQKQEEQQRQQIIEEYLAKQKELEQAEKEKAEEARIKAIIAEFLAQQQALGNDANKTEESNNQNS